MAVKIRMYRIGNNKRPFFRVVATDERRKINGRFLEIVGWYDPKVEGKNFELKNQVKDYSPIPWHPGAVKYFAEHGVKM